MAQLISREHRRCGALFSLDSMAFALHQNDPKQEGHAEQEAGHAKCRLKVDLRHERLPLCRSDFDPAHSALQVRWLRNANSQYAVAEHCVDCLLSGLKG